MSASPSLGIGPGPDPLQPEGSGRTAAGFPAWLSGAEVVLALWLLGIAATILVKTIRWPVVIDGAVLSYIVFLIDHGMAPYRDIIEMSFPGSYLAYWAALHVFGSSALGFRLFDYTILASATAAMFAIARPRGRWFVAVLGSVSLLITHAFGGIWENGQRDFIMAAILLSAVALALGARRHQRPLLFLGTGFCFAYATSIKPTSILFFLIPICVLLKLRKEGRAIRPYLLAGIAGALLATLLVVGFLVAEGSFRAFFDIVTRLDAVYATMKSPPLRKLLADLFWSTNLNRLLFVVAALWLLQRELRSSFTHSIVLLGTVCAAASFLLQRKGFHYHLLPFAAFSALWLAMVLVESLRETGWVRYVSGILLLVVAFLLLPRHLDYVLHQTFHQDYLTQLQEDLTHAGAGPGGKSVQCMEMAAGCTNVLYRMKIVQTTGFIADYYFFMSERFPIVPELRRRFLDQVTAAHTQIIVLTGDEWPTGIQGYDQLARWPELTAELDRNYHLSVERSSIIGDQPAGYRIYMHN